MQANGNVGFFTGYVPYKDDCFSLSGSGCPNRQISNDNNGNQLDCRDNTLFIGREK